MVICIKALVTELRAKTPLEERAERKNVKMLDTQDGRNLKPSLAVPAIPE